jgi:NADPH:quinone reductase
MRAAWYQKQGLRGICWWSARCRTLSPGPARRAFRIGASGINPGDIKKRQDSFGLGMSYPRVIPHSDGAGKVDQVGDGMSPEWVGRRL